MPIRIYTEGQLLRNTDAGTIPVRLLGLGLAGFDAKRRKESAFYPVQLRLPFGG